MVKENVYKPTNWISDGSPQQAMRLGWTLACGVGKAHRRLPKTTYLEKEAGRLYVRISVDSGGKGKLSLGRI